MDLSPGRPIGLENLGGKCHPSRYNIPLLFHFGDNFPSLPELPSNFPALFLYVNKFITIFNTPYKLVILLLYLLCFIAFLHCLKFLLLLDNIFSSLCMLFFTQNLPLRTPTQKQSSDTVARRRRDSRDSATPAPAVTSSGARRGGGGRLDQVSEEYRRRVARSIFRGSCDVI